MQKEIDSYKFWRHQLCNTIVFQVKKYIRYLFLQQNYWILILSTNCPPSSRTYHHLNILQVSCHDPHFLLLSDASPYFLNLTYTGGRNFRRSRCILLNIFSHITSTYKKEPPRLLPKIICLECKTDLHLKNPTTHKTAKQLWQFFLPSPVSSPTFHFQIRAE